MLPPPDNSSPPDEDDLETQRLPLTDLESSSASPPSRRKRVGQIALAVLALIVASTVLWNSIGPGRQQATQPSTPLITIPALLVSNVTNATVTLNGKKLAGHPPMIVSAYLETDVVTVTAPLFRPLTCQFKGLLTKTDPTRCLFTIGTGSAPYTMGVFFTPDDLPSAQQQQVTAPITQNLAQALQTTVQQGDYIATVFDLGTASLTSQRAAAPLRASATFVQGPRLAPTPSLPSPLISTCAQLICPAGFVPGNPKPAGPAWGGVLNVMLRWRFTDRTGAPIANVTYPPDAVAFRQPTLLPVQYVYDSSGWHLAPTIDLNGEMQAALCINGQTILSQQLIGPGFNVTKISLVHAAGCSIAVQVDGKGSGTFLWRFGVLLAADAGAHALLPDLPIAPQAELAAASR